jgi:hypothetical protein
VVPGLLVEPLDDREHGAALVVEEARRGKPTLPAAWPGYARLIG